MFKLRDYQSNILNALYKSLKTNNKILLSLPTGAGKTIMMYAWAKKMSEKGLKTVIVVDREELVEQTVKLDNNISVLKACSDYIFNPDKKIQVIMLQTGYRREEQLLELKPDYIFFDEIHQYIEGSMFRALCDFMNTAKIIGVTATPIDSKGYLLEGFDDYIGDLQVKDLIDKGYLVKPVYYTPSDYNLDLSCVRMTNGDYNIEDLDTVMINKNCAEKIYNGWKNKASDRHTICFCSSIKQANYLAYHFNNKGIKVEVLTSDDILPNRRAIIKGFKDKKIDILFNVGILVAGFDDPTVDCIMFTNPTRVLRRYLQQSGRGLRISENKSNCLMLDFADVVRQHGFCDDLRFFRKRKKIEDECNIKECPECGSIIAKNLKKCPYCNYDFSSIVEINSGSIKKKDLEKLEKAFNMQEELKTKISNLVDKRGYKTGYKWFLFIDCLKTKRPTESSVQFFKRKISKINRIDKKNYKLAALKYD